MTNRITSLEVAQRAGVSRAAVSRCFTHGASVAPETREKIMEVVRALGYRPNAIARSLITNRSRIIAVVMGHHLSNPFYAELLTQVSDALQSHGYRVLLFTGQQDDASDLLITDILPYQVDGILLASTGLSSALASECRLTGIPVVLLNRSTDNHDVSIVTSANFNGGWLAADFLLAGGHYRFGYIAGSEASSTNRDREAGYRERLNRAGISKIAVALGGYTQAGAAAAARELLGGANPPDALFCANDYMATAVIDVARHEIGLKIPDDVSIVGYDNTLPSSWPNYSITTVEQPVGVMVNAAIDILLSQLEKNEVATRQEVLPAELVIRNSARRPKDGIVMDGDRLVWRPKSQDLPPARNQDSTFD